MYFPSFISKILYAILVSPLQAKQSSFDDSQLAPQFKQSSYKRTIFTLHMVDSLVPGVAVADRLSLLMYRNNRVPWAQVGMQLIAFGSGTAVFKIDWKSSPKVLRIYRTEAGKSMIEKGRVKK